MKRLNHEMSYYINNLPETLPVFKAIQATGIESKEMYHVFNMGIGFAVILDEKYKDQALEILNKHYDSYVIGEVIQNDKNIVLIEKDDEKIEL